LPPLQVRRVQPLPNAGRCGSAFVAAGPGGTGKLKRGLRDWLATVPWVERVSDAEQGDGGPGCSVVWLK